MRKCICLKTFVLKSAGDLNCNGGNLATHKTMVPLVFVNYIWFLPKQLWEDYNYLNALHMGLDSLLEIMDSSDRRLGLESWSYVCPMCKTPHRLQSKFHIATIASNESRSAAQTCLWTPHTNIKMAIPICKKDDTLSKLNPNSEKRKFCRKPLIDIEVCTCHFYSVMISVSLCLVLKLCNQNVLPVLTFIFTLDEQECASMLKIKGQDLCSMRRNHGT